MKACLWTAITLTSLLSGTVLAQSNTPTGNIKLPNAGNGWRPIEITPQTSEYRPAMPPQNSQHAIPPPATMPAPIDNQWTAAQNNQMNNLNTPQQQSYDSFMPYSQETYYPYTEQQTYWPNTSPYSYPEYNEQYGNDGYYYGYNNDGYYPGYGAQNYPSSPYEAYGQDYYAPVLPAYGTDPRYPSAVEYYPNAEEMGAYRPSVASRPNGQPLPPMHSPKENLPLINGEPAKFRPWKTPGPVSGEQN